MAYQQQERYMMSSSSPPPKLSALSFVSRSEAKQVQHISTRERSREGTRNTTHFVEKILGEIMRQLLVFYGIEQVVAKESKNVSTITHRDIHLTFQQMPTWFQRRAGITKKL